MISMNYTWKQGLAWSLAMVACLALTIAIPHWWRYQPGTYTAAHIGLKDPQFWFRLLPGLFLYLCIAYPVLFLFANYLVRDKTEESARRIERAIHRTAIGTAVIFGFAWYLYAG